MSGVDPLNQFPNSYMAKAVKNGQSRMVSDDQPSQEVGEQNNLVVTSVTPLTVPATATYCTIQNSGTVAVDITLDGTTPTAGNWGVQLAVGASVSFYGQLAMAAIKMFGAAGAAVSAVYYR